MPAGLSITSHPCKLIAIESVQRCYYSYIRM
jgi:hypothetical protein